jgi:hypothetical protein
MVQAIDNPIAANFLTDAVVERHNFSQLNKTRIRFRIQLKKSTKSAAPKCYGKRMVHAKAAQLQEQFGECNITEETDGTVKTLRLTFAGHQQQQQYARR